jgi:hypothetical protein
MKEQMTNFTKDHKSTTNLDLFSIEELENLCTDDVIALLEKTNSNTDWSDTSKHVTMNGAKMNC